MTTAQLNYILLLLYRQITNIAQKYCLVGEAIVKNVPPFWIYLKVRVLAFVTSVHTASYDSKNLPRAMTIITIFNCSFSCLFVDSLHRNRYVVATCLFLHLLIFFNSQLVSYFRFGVCDRG